MVRRGKKQRARKNLRELDIPNSLYINTEKPTAWDIRARELVDVLLNHDDDSLEPWRIICDYTLGMEFPTFRPIKNQPFNVGSVSKWKDTCGIIVNDVTNEQLKVQNTRVLSADAWTWLRKGMKVSYQELV